MAYLLKYKKLIYPIIISMMLFCLPIKSNSQDPWYIGGNLHKANGLAWQKATYKNKLATCADIFATLIKSEKLKSQIQYELETSPDKMKTIMRYSHELVLGLDATFKKDPDPKQNEILFTNQIVSDTSILLVIMMGWVDL